MTNTTTDTGMGKGTGTGKGTGPGTVTMATNDAYASFMAAWRARQARAYGLPDIDDADSFQHADREEN